MSKDEIVTFRNARLDDAPRLLEIYRYYVEKTAISFEWTVPSLEEFQDRMKCTMKKYPYIVAVQNGRLVGYSYIGPFVGREAYAWSVETTIYLDAGIRHHGVGKQLYSVMEDILVRMHILNMNACIGYPKEDDHYLTKNSAEFHEHIGFQMVGRFHNSGYKFGTWYDMVWMEKMIGEHTGEPAPVLNYHDIEKKLIGGIIYE